MVMCRLQRVAPHQGLERGSAVDRLESDTSFHRVPHGDGLSRRECSVISREQNADPALTAECDQSSRIQIVPAKKVKESARIPLVRGAEKRRVGLGTRCHGRGCYEKHTTHDRTHTLQFMSAASGKRPALQPALDRPGGNAVLPFSVLRRARLAQRVTTKNSFRRSVVFVPTVFIRDSFGGLFMPVRMNRASRTT